MKYLMIVSSMVLGLAMPALAQDAPPAADFTKQQGTVQPPTNRLDKLVPPMKGPNDAASSSELSLAPPAVKASTRRRTASASPCRT